MPVERPLNPRAYPEHAPGGWTVESIRIAIRNLEGGYLAAPGRLLRAFPRDARYVQGREQFLGAVQGCPADILPAAVTYGGVGTARRLAREAGPILAHVLREGAERWMIEYGRCLNLAVGYLTWDTTVRPWRPISLERWPTDAIDVDMYARKLWAITTTGRIEIVPGNGTWVVYAPSGLFNFDAGLLRCFGEAWIRRIMAGRDVANRSQASSVACIVAPQPEGTGTESEEEKARRDDYKANLQAAQQGGPAGIMPPPGWEAPTALDLATKDGSDMLDLALKTSTTDLLVPWLLQDGTATNEGGSLAKAQVLGDVLYAAVASTVASLWGEVAPDKSHFPGVFTSQILLPWVVYQLSEMVREEGEEREIEAARLCPLALRRVPDLEEDARLKAQADRAGAFWREVGLVEGAIRRDLTAEELIDLAKLRGAQVPETILKEARGTKPEPNLTEV